MKLADMTLQQKQALYKKAKVAYYNDTPLMPDAQFDKLEDSIRADLPSWKELSKTGVPVADKKAKTTLSHFMPSLHKVYPEAANAWIRNNISRQCLVMDKLDGGALLIDYLDGKPWRLCTRGTGVVGGDISFLIKRLRLPNIPYKGPIGFRAEGVIAKEVFAKKYANEFDNARNMVNGLLNRKDNHTAAFADIEVVIVGVYTYKLLLGLETAKSWGLRVVDYRILDKADADDLTACLLHRADHGRFNVDGLVLANPDSLFSYSSNNKPSWTTAFKFNDEENATQARVVDVHYQISRHGRIIPKIEIKPTRLSDATVKYCTLHNAQWMESRKIGPGAVIKILRSGGVIPKIVGVVRAGTFKAPDVPYTLKGVHFVLAKGASDASTREVAIKQNLRFLTQLGVEFCASKSIATLYDAGCTTPFHYMKAAQTNNTAAFMRAGIGKAMSIKIINDMRRAFASVPMLHLMVASNVFPVGVGERRLEMIRASGITMTKLLSMSSAEAMEYIVALPGFQTTTARLIVSKLPKFRAFLGKAEKFLTVVDKKPKDAKVINGRFTGMTFSFTGYRSEEQEKALTANGGLVAAFGSKTQVLLVSPSGKASTKADKAAAKGIKVCQFSDLKIKE